MNQIKMLGFDTRRLESWCGVDRVNESLRQNRFLGCRCCFWNLALLTISSRWSTPLLAFCQSSLSALLLPSFLLSFLHDSPFCIYLFLHLILPWIDSFTSGALTDKCCWLTNLSGQHVCLLNPRPRFPISCGYLAPQSLSMCPKLVLFTFCHKSGVICISEVIDISPGNLDSSLCFFQPSTSHDVLCIEVK